MRKPRISSPASDVTYEPGTYRSAIDGLRGLSIVCVLLYHDDEILPGGYLGVDIFFVLSGFLITSLLVKEWRKTGRIDFGRFYLRRALRLFPALAALLMAGAVFVFCFPKAPQAPRILRAIKFSAIYVTNWVNAKDPFSLGPFSHTWSLSVEEQFYLIWPLILLFFLSHAKTLKRVAIATGGLALTFALWRFILSYRGVSAWRIYNGTDTRADSLLAGATLAVLMSHISAWPLHLVRASRYLSIVALLMLAFLIRSTPLGWVGFGRGMFSVVALGVAVILYTVLMSPRWWFARVTTIPTLVWIGRLSYSLYLWHLPIFGFLKAPLLGMTATQARLIRLPVSLVVAIASFYLIEQPFLRLKDRFGRGSSSRYRVLASSESPLSGD